MTQTDKPQQSTETPPLCAQCGQQCTAAGIGTGYGYDRDDRKICYGCCGFNDSVEFDRLPVGGKTIMYLSEVTGRTYTHKLGNWPGTFEIPIRRVNVGRHNIARVRYDFAFTWYGKNYVGVQVGDNTQIAHIRRVQDDKATSKIGAKSDNVSK